MAKKRRVRTRKVVQVPHGGTKKAFQVLKAAHKSGRNPKIYAGGQLSYNKYKKKR